MLLCILVGTGHLNKENVVGIAHTLQNGNRRTIMTHNREDVTDYGVLFIIGFIAFCVLL